MKVLYTCIFGDKYHLREPASVVPGWEYVCFTDRADLRSDIYRFVLAKPVSNPKLSSRHVKIFSGLALLHVFKTLPEVSVYIDSRFTPPATLDTFVDALPSVDLVVMAHNRRKNIAAEAAFLAKKQIESPVLLTMFLAAIRSAGYDPDSTALGLYAPGVMVRRYTSDCLGKFEAMWWAWVSRFSTRDQLSLPLAIYSSGVRLHAMLFRETYKLFMGDKANVVR